MDTIKKLNRITAALMGWCYILHFIQHILYNTFRSACVKKKKKQKYIWKNKKPLFLPKIINKQMLNILSVLSKIYFRSAVDEVKKKTIEIIFVHVNVVWLTKTVLFIHFNIIYFFFKCHINGFHFKRTKKNQIKTSLNHT